MVESSIGHIRDLPDKAADIPAKYKKEPWARLGVNVDAGFEPLYVVNPDKKQQVGKLRKLLDEADELLLATDEDREGEAIAWHLLEVLKPKVPARRMVFHEITPEAIATAVASPRELNQGLVDAQETRRILDRLYGYEVSPVLWKKVMPRLSAGRVQSVATRLVVERERERIAFRAASYWDIEAVFGSRRSDAEPPEFAATLVALDGRRVAQGRDFSSAAQLKTADAVQLDEADAAGLAQRLTQADFTVRSVEREALPAFALRPVQDHDACSRRRRASSASLPSTRCPSHSGSTRTGTSPICGPTASRCQRRRSPPLARRRGSFSEPNTCRTRPRVYTSKVKNAQEAHEAIRPAGDEFATPSASRLTGDEFRLYELVWKRTVASQMKDAAGESVSVRVAGRSSAGEDAEFGASGKVITFHGFLKAYVEDADDPETDREDTQHRLPPLATDDPLAVVSLAPAGHSTRPPARYTEATLVKELEDREIGRPSTYASIIGTILDRGYVFRKGTALVPSFLAFAVVTLLERHFGHLVDYDFTARMEDVLDEIARGEAARVPWLRRFYFGENGENGSKGEEGLKELVSDLGDIDAREVSSFPLPGTAVVVRVGRYGPYLERDGERVNVPEGTAPDELTPERAEELFAQPSGERVLGTDPETGRTIVAKVGRYGPYVTELIGSEADGAPDKSAESGPPRQTPKLAHRRRREKAGAEKAGADRAGTDRDGAAEAKTAKPRRRRPQRRRPKSKAAKAEAVKPRAASLLKTMTLDTVTLQDAMRLLTLPRVLGELDGELVTVQNGRYGPYAKRGSDSRSLESEEQLFTLTLTEAKDLFAQPKTRGRARGAAAPPLRELGDDPVTGKPLVIKSGRYGPYVTDGETNASLRKGDEVESITLQRGAELLADRRAAGPAPRRGRSGASSGS